MSKVSSRQYTSGWKSVALREIPVHGTYVTILITGLLSRDNLCRPLIPHNRINTHAMGTGSPCRLLFGGRPDNGWTGRERERERDLKREIIQCKEPCCKDGVDYTRIGRRREVSGEEDEEVAPVLRSPPPHPCSTVYGVVFNVCSRNAIVWEPVV